MTIKIEAATRLLATQQLSDTDIENHFAVLKSNHKVGIERNKNGYNISVSFDKKPGKDDQKLVGHLGYTLAEQLGLRVRMQGADYTKAGGMIELFEIRK